MTYTTLCRSSYQFVIALLTAAVPFLAVAQPPTDAVTEPKLEVRTESGGTTFRLGERIGLQLSFTAPVEQQLQMSTAGYDRSGRINSEHFEITPLAGWTDPLAKYFASAGGSLGGGLAGIAQLSTRPEVIFLNLNEWVRFDRPGDYRLVVQSSRVYKRSKNSSRVETLPARSNQLQLHIVAPSLEWQAATLSAALETLRDEPERNGFPLSPKRAKAIADLRYLASADAIEELAEGLRTEASNSFYQAGFGLMGLPEAMQETALKAMRKRLDRPDFPVTSNFLLVMSVLQIQGTRSPEEMRAQCERFRVSAWESALAALPRKLGEARAVTASMLLSQRPDDLSEDQQAQLAGVLTASFADLPEMQQANELNGDWLRLRSALPVSTLAKLAQLPLRGPSVQPNDQMARSEVKVAALSWWYEMDPQGALQQITTEIGTETPTLAVQDLYILPKMSLPQFESVWARALQQEHPYFEEGRLLELLARFGTGAANAQIAAKARTQVGQWECVPQAAALAYLVRFDQDSVGPLLREAVEARGQRKSSCRHSLFTDIARHGNGSPLTEEAIHALHDPDLEVVANAAWYLSRDGDMSARKPLLIRYMEWSRAASGLGEQADMQSGSDDYLQRSLGNSLGKALLAGQGWLSDQELTTQVLLACTGKEICRELEGIAAEAKPPYKVIFSPTWRGLAGYHIAQYELDDADALKRKLAQYAKGTSFVLIHNGRASQERAASEAIASKLFQEAGMALVPPEALRPIVP